MSTQTTLDTAAIARQLQARLRELTGSIARLEGERGDALPADFAEQAQMLDNQDALEGIEDAQLAETAAIGAALHRIATGHYGLCTTCGDSIAPARLAALPMAATCIGCAR